MRQEVEEAWSTYKTSQERSAAREAELLDEIKQLQRAKQTDKQQSLQHFTKLNEEIDSLKLQMALVVKERDEWMEKTTQLSSASSETMTKEESLIQQLAEMRLSHQQTIQALREEIHANETAMETLRYEHNQWIRQSHNRQSELERESAELGAAVAEKQRLIQQLQRQLEQAGKDSASARELDGLRLQLSALEGVLEQERERAGKMEHRARVAECDCRALQLVLEEERGLAAAAASASASEIAALEAKLKQLDSDQVGEASGASAAPRRPRVFRDDIRAKGDSILPGGEDAARLQQQVANLSAQLLSKQGSMQSLQAERAALKARLEDALHRSGS